MLRTKLPWFFDVTSYKSGERAIGSIPVWPGLNASTFGSDFSRESRRLLD